ncbi:Sensor histidine kinase YesM [Virgibacillus subterraneus]|uniref:histidine kinase n=1 Tax=Virgibacillus subterraneus TaxID=621109 RepID=A0A1H9AYD9_9BACI|nr:sensor histidine kinase [Virgibacillus subterraneus]SEP81744.1 Sensor histidine kinase YesM [Virgibacillus subterraneus]
MKTIRGKLIVYFFVFVLLFQVTAISIFISSNDLTNAYNKSFQRFLLLNSISEKTKDLYTYTKTFVTESEAENAVNYYDTKKQLQEEKEKLESTFYYIEKIEMKNYTNLIETFIHESELTVGFVIKDDIEQYLFHLEETSNASGYIQESTLEMMDLEMTAYKSFYEDLQLRNNNFLLFTIFLFVTTSMIAIFFALWFSKGITRPVGDLSRAAKEVSKGDLLGEPIKIQSNDELKLLGDTFNHMRSNIHELVEEIKDQSELDRLLKEMELKHLQNQVNPHFLFNTLNTISKMAYLEDAKSTSSLIDSVAKLLRHSLGEIESSVTLADEVDVVKDYFHIQKTRFSERIIFNLDVDEKCLDVKVPRLTLQPLVENAFIHGIEGEEDGGIIKLHIYQRETNIIVEVSDDGVGMAQDKVNELVSLMKQPEHVGHSTGIGLTNVIRRLQLFNQNSHVVEIESDIGVGTTIRLFLPME